MIIDMVHVLLTWDQNYQTDTFYILYGDSLEEPTQTFEVTAPYGSDSKLIGGLVNDTTYYFAIGAINRAGASELSEIVSATPFTPTPETPQNFVAYSTDSKIRLTWERSLYADQYVLEYKKHESSSEEIIQITTTQTSIVIANLINELSYDFKIKALNTKGESPYSELINSSPRVSFTEPIYGIEMVKIYNGKFMMGELDGYPHNGPIHEVAITQDYFIGKYEITKGQWNTVMGSTQSQSETNNGYDYTKKDFAANTISWDEINRTNGFLDLLNQSIGCDISKLRTGLNRYFPSQVPKGCFRLPTEAEWEYAARAGTDTTFSYGDDIKIQVYGGYDYQNLSSYAWYNSYNGGSGVQKVGQKLPNPWGLYDVHGNVSEWVFDYVNNHEYSNLSQIDPSGIIDSPYRGIRGGAWDTFPKYLYVGYRSISTPNYTQNISNGFRIVLTLPSIEISNITLENIDNFSVEAGDESVNLNWDPVTSASSYKIMIKSESLPDQLVTTTGSTIKINQLSNNRQYKFTIQAVNIFKGLSPISNPIYAIPTQGVPTAPTKIRLQTDDGTIKIFWEKVNNARSYKVYFSSESQVSVDSSSKETADTNITIKPDLLNRRYQFRLKAINETGTSSLTETYSIMVYSDYKDPFFGIDLVRIPKGSFMMGSPNNDPNNGYDEKPYHRINITQGFYIGKYELTQGQWKAITNEDKWDSFTTNSPIKVGSNYPAFQISWDDLTEVGGFLDQLNQKISCDISGLPIDSLRYSPKNVPDGCFRLPTEAEWEYMAKGGYTDQYTNIGEDNINDYAWFDNKSSTSPTSPQIVGGKLPNPWGIYNVLGNVNEWVYDAYNSTKYNDGDIFDPINTHGWYQMTRGGNWDYNQDWLRITKRTSFSNFFRTLYTGVRLLYVSKQKNESNKLNAPSNLVGIAGDSQVSFTWDPVDGATAYKIYYSTTSDMTTNIQSVIAYLTNVTIPNLVNDQKYFFNISAINLQLEKESNSNQVHFTPTLQKPNTPANVKSTSFDTKIYLSWDHTFHADYYQVSYRSNQDSQDKILTSTQNEISINNLENNQIYYFSVRAVNEKGLGKSSQTIQASPLETWIEPLTNIELVKIPNDQFYMGSSLYDNVSSNEKPQHLITLSNDFFIGKYELTQKEWNTITKLKAPHIDFGGRFPTGDQYPTMYISWENLTKQGGFLDKANTILGCNLDSLPTDNTRYNADKVPPGCFRLPTEAEWEYVVKAGGKTIKALGSSISSNDLIKYAWYNEVPLDYNIKKVGLKIPNPWGVYDLFGNVSELVQDIYDADYYSVSETNNPIGPSEGFYRIHRGGSWQNTIDEISTTKRHSLSPYDKELTIGFRLAMTVPKITRDLGAVEMLKLIEGDSQIGLQWEPIVGASAYEVSYFSTPSSVNQLIVTNTNCTIFNLMNDSEYKIKIDAFNPTQRSIETNEYYYATPKLLKPKTPNGVISSIGANTLNVYWDSVFHADTYKVYIEKNTNVSLSSQYISTNSSNLTINNLDEGGTYNVRVKAVNQMGESDFSTPVKATIYSHITEPIFNIEMVKIPAGTFIMGESNIDSKTNYQERYQRSTTISNDFYIGKYEVTQGQWLAVMEYDSYSDFEKDSTVAAGLISWDRIVKVDGFLDKLNTKTGCDTSGFESGDLRYLPMNIPSGCFRIPTEAEWEYMARAGNSEHFYFGNDIDNNKIDDFAWTSRNSVIYQKVGQKIGNRWGVYDVVGNMIEWTLDEFRQEEVSNSPVIDPILYGTDQIYVKVIRGGTYEYGPDIARSSKRLFKHKSTYERTTGFRLLRVP